MENRQKARRIIIDTKFNELLSRGWHRDETIRNSYVYQMYAYLRSQEDFVEDSLARTAAGVLLHPTVSRFNPESRYLVRNSQPCRICPKHTEPYP